MNASAPATPATPATTFSLTFPQYQILSDLNTAVNGLSASELLFGSSLDATAMVDMGLVEMVSSRNKLDFEISDTLIKTSIANAQTAIESNDFYAAITHMECAAEEHSANIAAEMRLQLTDRGRFILDNMPTATVTITT